MPVPRWARGRTCGCSRPGPSSVDPAARRLLDAAGTWAAPDDDAYPTGRSGATAYLQPLAALLDGLDGGSVRYGARWSV